MTTARVLIVDDDPVVRETLTYALEDERWEVVVAASAEEGLAVWEPGEWATLVVDKNLPGMSGVDLIREVRQSDTAVGILMITAYSSVQTALDTLHLGVDGYLEKPFEDIFAVVRDIGDAVETQTRRRRAGSMAGAVSHFARASEHLAAIQKQDRPLRVLLGIDPESAAWIRERLGEAEVEVAPTKLDVLAGVRQRWDLVVIDSGMNAADPVAWIREVRDVAPEVSCVVVSSRPTFDVVTQLIRLRVGAVLEKPFTDRQFELRIGPILERARRQLGGATPVTAGEKP
jgi:DNA-binding response OmpR family regulator